MYTMYFDCETTGLSVFTYGICQMGFILEKDGIEEGRREYKPALFTGQGYNDKALEVNGMARDEIEAGTPAHEVYRDVVAWLDSLVNKYDKKDKIFMVGFNTHFDYGHLDQFFRKAGNKYGIGSYFFSPPICAGQVALPHLMLLRRSMDNYQLKSVASTIGIHIDESRLHDAMYDIELTRDVYKWALDKTGVNFKF